MNKKWLLKHASLLAATILSSVIIGLCIAFFLSLLEKATDYRNDGHNYLLYLLPIAGVVIYFAYQYWGKLSAKGNNLIISEIQKPKYGIPLVMTPLVLFGTVLTHLFGGSAGREGTAVQIGGSIAEKIGKLFHIESHFHKILLISGVAAGFSAVFGTPLTGFLFSLEVIVIGQLMYEGALYALLAAFIADYVCKKCGIHHTVYTISTPWNSHFLQWGNLVRIIIASIIFGLVANLFSYAILFFKGIYNKFIPYPWLVPVIGAIVILILCQFLGLQYIGLGVTPNYDGAASIVGAFKDQNITTWSWFWKLLLTTITLSAGFKGGEVTPLFFVGATLGNTLAHVMGLPIDVMAALGFIAVFAGATNTPLACAVMGLELFGGTYFPLFIIVCFVAFYSNMWSGIYESQLITRKKILSTPLSPKSLGKYSQQHRLVIFRKWSQFCHRFL